MDCFVASLLAMTRSSLPDHSAPAAMALSRHLHKVNACMPELPEVETVRRGLQPAMEGSKILKAEARRKDLRFPFQKDFIARLEGQIALETLFRRYPDLRLAVPETEITWAPSFLRSLTGLPLLF